MDATEVATQMQSPLLLPLQCETEPVLPIHAPGDITSASKDNNSKAATASVSKSLILEGKGATTGTAKGTTTPTTTTTTTATTKRVSKSLIQQRLETSSASSKGTATSGRPKRVSASNESLKSKEDIEKEARSWMLSQVRRTYYVGQTNGWKMVVESMDRRGWTQLPFEYQFSSRFGFKWVERRSQIDYRAHVAGQLVCHIQNNDIICTKVGLLSCLREYFCKRTVAPVTPTRTNPSSLTGSSKESSKAGSAGAAFGGAGVDGAVGAVGAGDAVIAKDSDGVGVGVGVSGAVSNGRPARRPARIPWLPETYDLEIPGDVAALMRIEEEEAAAFAAAGTATNVTTAPATTADTNTTGSNSSSSRSSVDKDSSNSSSSSNTSSSEVDAATTATDTYPKTTDKAGLELELELEPAQKAAIEQKKASTIIEPTTQPTAEAAAAAAVAGVLWIYKPTSMNRGRGIKLVKGIADVRELCYGKQTDDPDTSIAPARGIMQRYILAPLLVMPGRQKFDIRCYLLIATNSPHTVAYYHPGYCRLALKPYDLDDISDNTVHLTNASIQKKDPIYQAMKDQQIQTVAAVADSMAAAGLADSAKYMREGLDKDIKLCMVDILKASAGKLMRKAGFFDLFGCDFMLSAQNELVLLEVNTNPAMSRDNWVLADLLPRVLDGAIDKVLTHQRPDDGTYVGNNSNSNSNNSSGINNNSNDTSTNTSTNTPAEGGEAAAPIPLTTPDHLVADYQLLLDEQTGFCYA